MDPIISNENINKKMYVCDTWGAPSFLRILLPEERKLFCVFCSKIWTTLPFIYFACAREQGAAAPLILIRVAWCSSPCLVLRHGPEGADWSAVWFTLPIEIFLPEVADMRVYLFNFIRKFSVYRIAFRLKFKKKIGSISFKSCTITSKLFDIENYNY